MAMNDEFKAARKILKLANRIVNTRTKDLEELCITAEQSESLQFFDANAGATASDLKNYLGISHQAARNLVERMKKKELLHVVVSEEDTRSRSVYLTEKGINTCETLKRFGTNKGHTLLNGLSKEEKEHFISLLERISSNVGV